MRPLPDRLQTRLPVWQGGMTFGSDARLAIAVAEAGGLGTLGTFHYRDDPAALERELATLEASGQPYLVNVPFFENNLAVVERCVAAGARMFALGGWCSEAVCELAAERELVLVCSAISPQVIDLLSARPIDALIVQGNGSGGTNASYTARQLIRYALEQTELPLIAAGGFWDGHDLFVARQLGCAALQLGTRFFFADESPLHASIKERVISQAARRAPVTELTPVNDTLRMRFLVNKPYKQHRRRDELPELFADKERVFELSARFAEQQEKALLMYAGAGVHQLSALQTCAEILEELARDYGQLRDSPPPPLG